MKVSRYYIYFTPGCVGHLKAFVRKIPLQCQSNCSDATWYR